MTEDELYGVYTKIFALVASGAVLSERDLDLRIPSGQTFPVDTRGLAAASIAVNDAKSTQTNRLKTKAQFISTLNTNVPPPP
jgi:hypothetical protein